jgi:formiminotetrahydrofolate cyclodeaminase
MDDIPVIKDCSLEAYFRKLSADSLYPSAGSSAAVTAAHAAALFALACRVNLRKIKENPLKKEGGENRETFWQETLHKADSFWEQSLDLAQKDGFAIKEFMEGAPQSAEKATDIPLQIAHCAGAIILLIEHALPQCYAPVKADAESARCLAEGSRNAALTIARYNLQLLDQEARNNYVNKILEIERKL